MATITFTNYSDMTVYLDARTGEITGCNGVKESLGISDCEPGDIVMVGDILPDRYNPADEYIY